MTDIDPEYKKLVDQMVADCAAGMNENMLRDGHPWAKSPQGMWLQQASDELDGVFSSANAVLQEMLQDGTWEGTDPVNAVKQVLFSMLGEDES